MSRALADQGHSCTILTVDIGLTRDRRESIPNVRIVALPCLSERFYLPRFSFSAISAMVRDAEIIHLMGNWTFLNAVIYISARRHHKNYVVCPAGTLPIFGRSKVFKRIYHAVVGKAILRHSQRCIAITADEAADLKKAGAIADSISVIPNGIRLEEYAAKDDIGFRRAHHIPNVPFILYCGRLNPIKGPDLLLRAFCALKGRLSHHLVMAGPDEGMLTGLRDMVRREGLDERVHFVGYLGGTEKSQAFHAADLLAIPSRSEAMSIVVLEAGAAGTPVLATNRLGFDELSSVGGGVVVPATDDGLRRGLSEMLLESADLRLMGSRLRDYVERKFTWDKMALKYSDLYAEIVGGMAPTVTPPATDGK